MLHKRDYQKSIISYGTTVEFDVETIHTKLIFISTSRTDSVFPM